MPPSSESPKLLLSFPASLVLALPFLLLFFWEFERSKAASFSFLMVVPLILGKIAKDLMDGGIHVTESQIGVLIAGFLAAFLTGILACQWMIKLVRNAQLVYFSYYCFIVGTLAISYQVFQ